MHAAGKLWEHRDLKNMLGSVQGDPFSLLPLNSTVQVVDFQTAGCFPERCAVRCQGWDRNRAWRGGQIAFGLSGKLRAVERPCGEPGTGKAGLQRERKSEGKEK